MLIAIWTMATTGALYQNPGPNFYAQRNPDRAKQRAVYQLRALGYEVTLNPTQTTRSMRNLRGQHEESSVRNLRVSIPARRTRTVVAEDSPVESSRQSIVWAQWTQIARQIAPGVQRADR
jgi:hypothetical protein